jgi:hypothetical protein
MSGQPDEVNHDVLQTHTTLILQNAMARATENHQRALADISAQLGQVNMQLDTGMASAAAKYTLPDFEIVRAAVLKDDTFWSKVVDMAREVTAERESEAENS